MPPIEPTPGDAGQEDRHEKNLASLFGDETPDTSEDEKAEESSEVDETEDAEEAEDSDASEDAESSDDAEDSEGSEDEDYEAPVKKKKESEKKDDEEPGPENETIARKMAKENGRRAKQAEAKVTELELELDRVKTELEARQARLQEVESLQVDPRDFPEVKAVREKVMTDVKRGAAMLGVKDPAVFRNNFGTYITSFMDADSLDGEEFDNAIGSLRKQIIKEVGGFEDAYEDLDFTEQAKADLIADKALAVIERAVPDTKKAIELAESLKSRAKVGHLAVGTREYDAAMSEFKPVLDAVGDLPEEAIAADPHSVPTIVARMVKESPEARRRVERAKADVLEIIIGPRALSPDEVSKLEANGKDIKAFYAERQKMVQEKRKKLLPLLVQGLATRALFADALKKLAKYEEADSAEDTEFDAMEQLRKKKPVPPKKKEPVPAGRRRNTVLTELYGDRYDEL